MIHEAELRRLAAANGVDTMVQDLDYGLGWFLAGLFATTTPPLIFKGGTCLRKCYFADYRFSEDLDFTLTEALPLEKLAATFTEIQTWSQAADGPNFDVAPMQLEVVNDEYGLESYQARIYYRGALRWGGPPRSIQLDISRGEPVAFTPAQRTLLHPYSDASRMPPTIIPCYDLAEMLIEKLRAISGQRRFAISRDIYDIYRLTENGVDLDLVRLALPVKFAAKGIAQGNISPENLSSRRLSFEADWQRRLAHLLPLQQPVTFEMAWQRVLDTAATLTQSTQEPS